MVAQRFDIEITDKVARSIKTEISGIAAAAQQAMGNLASLQNEVKSLASSQSTASRAAREAASTVRETGKAAQEAARQSQVARKAAEDEAAARDRISKMVRRSLEEQKQAVKQVSAEEFTAWQRGLAQKAAAENVASGESMSSLNAYHKQRQSELKAQADWELKLEKARQMEAAVQRKVEQAQIRQEAALRIKEMADEARRLNPVLDEVNKRTNVGASYVHRFGMNVVSAGSWIGTTTPTVRGLTRELLMLNRTAAAAGASMGTLAMGAAAALVPFLPIIAAVGAATAAFALMNRDINKQADDLKGYARSLGLTEDQIKDLKNTTITWGDTAKAVFQVGFKRVLNSFGVDVQDMKTMWSNALDFMWSKAKSFLTAVYSGFRGTIGAIAETWTSRPEGGFGTIANFVEAAKKGYASGKASAVKELEGLYADVQSQAITNAKNRIDKQAEKLFKDAKPARTGRSGKDPAQERAEQLAKVNRELDAQIQLLGFYGPALEREAKFQQINNSLLDRKIKLTAQEEESIRRRIALIQEGARVQEALNKIEQAALGPQRSYEAAVKAITIALEKNIISEAEATRQRNLAKTAYTDALDPMRQYRDEIDKTRESLILYGEDLAVAQRARELFERDVAAGVTTRDQSSPANYKEIAGQEYLLGQYNQAMAAADPRRLDDPTSPEYLIQNYQKIYDAIGEMREANLIDEEEAQRRMQNLQEAHNEARLNSVSNMFGALTVLSQSKNKKVAAIGKAAAIAQATIDTYSAVNAAYKAPPGPPWSIPIAATIGAMGLANVAKIAGIGFQSGGFTGYGAPSSAAGVVHRGEYVFDAGTTKRIGVGNLDAMRSGKLSGGPIANDNRPVVNIVPQPGVFVEERRTPAGEIELIARRVVAEDAPRVVASNLQGRSNGVMSKAIRTSFGVPRADR